MNNLHRSIGVLCLLGIAALAAPARAETDGNLGLTASGGLEVDAPIEASVGSYWIQEDGWAWVPFESSAAHKATFTNLDNANPHNFQIAYELVIGYDDDTRHDLERLRSANYPNAITWAAGAGGQLVVQANFDTVFWFVEGLYTAYADTTAKSFAGPVVAAHSDYKFFFVEEQ